MFRRISTILVFSVLLISISFAQDIKKTGGLARIMGMGNNPYIIDPFFNSVNPAWNAVYNDFVLGDIGSNASSPFGAGGNGQYFSGSFSVANNWTVGGILARNDFNGRSIALLDPGTNNPFGAHPLGNQFTGVVEAVNNLAEGSLVVPMDNNVEIIGTYSSGNTSLGLGIAYASTTKNVTPDTGATTEGSASQIGFNLGVILDFNKNFKLDVGASLMLPSASYKPPVTGTGGNEAKADQTIILVNARAFVNVNNKLQIVPLLVFTTASGTLDSGFTSTASVDMVSFSSFTFGFGLNYQTGDFLLAGGVSFTSASITIPAISSVSPEFSPSSTFFPVWNIGGEWNMLDWLVGRLGYFAVTESRTNEFGNSTNNTFDESVTTFFGPSKRGATVGVGFRFGDFSLDATVNEDVLRQGFNMIGGGGNTNNAATFAYMTASYAIQ